MSILRYAKSLRLQLLVVVALATTLANRSNRAEAQFRGFGGSLSNAVRGFVPSSNRTGSSNRFRTPSVMPPSRLIPPPRQSLGQQVGQAVLSAAMDSIARPTTRRGSNPQCVQPMPAPTPMPIHNGTPVIIDQNGTTIITSTPVAPSQTVVAGRPAPSPTEEELRLRQIRDLVGEAKQKFRGGEYDVCVELVSNALELSPEDADLLQFRGFAHFAANEIESAAADIYDALLVGQTWNWDAVRDLYQSKPLYEMHLRRLETQRREQPSMVGHFTLAYQYLTLGHLQRGRKELQQALSFQPEEPLMVQLVSVVDQAITEK